MLHFGEGKLTRKSSDDWSFEMHIPQMANYVFENRFGADVSI